MLYRPSINRLTNSIAQSFSKKITSFRFVSTTNANKTFEEPIKGIPSMEYHRSSTRYSNSNEAMLKALDKAPMIPHKMPNGPSDKLAWSLVRFLRVASDMYFKDDLMNRAMMLETVAAVPGMVGGMIHHLRSLRTVQHDNWIRTLLDEAENERIHLFCFVDIIKPNLAERLLILGVQGVMFYAYLFTYILFPKSSHRFVGYLEEEAYKTYTHFLEMIDSGRIKNIPAPQIAIDYYNMPANSTLRDMILTIRADERDHATVNHSMANSIVKLRQHTVQYTEISIDDSVFENTPGIYSKHDKQGQVEAKL